MTNLLHTAQAFYRVSQDTLTPVKVAVENALAARFPDTQTASIKTVSVIDKQVKVVIHLDQGNNNSKFRTFFDNATANGVKYDVIGLSYYPYWLGTDYTSTITNLESNLKDMNSRYNKEVMVVEVGGDYTLVQNTYDMLIAVIKAVKSVPNNKGLGVIYWEPEGEKSWSGYQLNAWQSDGKPSPALDAFK